MRIVKPQVVGLFVCILATMEFPQNNGRPVRRKPHIEEVNGAVRTHSVMVVWWIPAFIMSLDLSLEKDAILTRLKVGRLCSAPDDLLKRDAAYSSSSYTGRIQKWLQNWSKQRCYFLGKISCNSNSESFGKGTDLSSA